MKEKGVSADSLAGSMGISVSSLNQSISGNPRLDTITKIAELLGVSITELFEKRPEPTLTCPHCGKEIHIKIE